MDEERERRTSVERGARCSAWRGAERQRGSERRGGERRIKRRSVPLIVGSISCESLVLSWSIEEILGDRKIPPPPPPLSD